MRYDPMTGQPLPDEEPQQTEMRYDPMTGAPITPQGGAYYNQNGQQAGAGYDPNGQNVQPTAAYYNYNQNAGTPAGKAPKKFPKWPVIAACAAAAVAVVGVVIVKAVPRLMFGRNYKIVQAVQNTFEPNQLMENCNFMDVIASGKYTVEAEGEYEGVKANARVSVNTSAKEASVEAGASGGGVDLEFAAKIDDKQILASLPGIVDETFLYSFSDQKDGWLIDMLEEEDIDVEKFDRFMIDLLSGKQSKEISSTFADALSESVKRMEFKKSDKYEVEIDGKDRTCQGYTLAIDEDLIEDLCDIYEKAWEESIEGVDDLLSERNMNLSDIFDDIRDSADGLEGELTVYIYKKQIGAIALELDRDEAVLELHGGSTPWENATLLIEDEKVMRLSGSMEKGVESLELRVYGSDERFSYEYDTKQGGLTVNYEDGYSELELEAVVTSDRNGHTFELSELSEDGRSTGLEGRLVIKEGAKIADISVTDAFDIGNASESDWQEILMEIYSGFYGSYSYW